MLGLNFAYATNGREIHEFDYFTVRETVISDYPTSAELWVHNRGANQLYDWNPPSRRPNVRYRQT